MNQLASPARKRVNRQTVDLSGYPDLVVIYLGMRQVWRDFDSLEAWTRTQPHRKWWPSPVSEDSLSQNGYIATGEAAR